jgi:hypothetical protein
VPIDSFIIYFNASADGNIRIYNAVSPSRPRRNSAELFCFLAEEVLQKGARYRKFERGFALYSLASRQ